MEDANPVLRDEQNRERKASALEVMNQLQEQGFRHNFRFDLDRLVCIESEKRYRAEELTIEASYRFEGKTDPDDEEILYVIKATDGTGGLFMDAFGVNADPEIAQFCAQIPDHRHDSTIMATIPASKTIEIVVAEKSDAKSATKT